MRFWESRIKGVLEARLEYVGGRGLGIRARGIWAPAGRGSIGSLRGEDSKE